MDRHWMETEGRASLIARIQAYVYEHVPRGKYAQAQRAADYALERFDDMIAHNPADVPGYWAGYYFDRFKDALEG